MDSLQESSQDKDALQMPRNSTLVHSLKNKYIVRSRHGKVGKIHFKPVNGSEAKSTIENQVIHDPEAFKGLKEHLSILYRSDYNNMKR